MLQSFYMSVKKTNIKYRLIRLKFTHSVMEQKLRLMPYKVSKMTYIKVFHISEDNNHFPLIPGV